MPKPSIAPKDLSPKDPLAMWRALLVQMIGADVDTAHKSDRRWLRVVDDLFWGDGGVAWQKLQHLGEGELETDDYNAAAHEGRPALVRLGKLVVLYYAFFYGDAFCLSCYDKTQPHPPTPWCFRCCCRHGEEDIPLAAGLIAVGAMTLPVDHFVLPAAGAEVAQ